MPPADEPPTGADDVVARDGRPMPPAEAPPTGADDVAAREARQAPPADPPPLAAGGASARAQAQTHDDPPARSRDTRARRAWRPPVADAQSATVTGRSASPSTAFSGSTEGDLAVAAQTREVTSAAVLGRPGEVEPVAAALALALRRETRAATATVGLVGAGLPEIAEGGRAARRLSERLEHHGFEVRVRGRLAWVRLDPEDGRIAAAARRLTLVGAPAVLAVSAPRNADTDSALLDCDLLLVVASDPEGPLASLAASGLTDVPIVTVRPLGRGPARALARAGIRPARSVRHVLSTEKEQR